MLSTKTSKVLLASMVATVGLGIFIAIQVSRAKMINPLRELFATEDILPIDSDTTIGFIGDSLAHGLGAESYQDTPGYIISQHFNAKYVNLSKCGATSSDLFYQAKAISLFEPSIVVIFIGTNDITHGKNLISALANIEHSIRLLRLNGCHVFLVPCIDLHVVYSISQPLRKALGLISRRYSRYQSQRAEALGAFIINQGNILSHFTHDGMFSLDRFHPSSAGYRLIAEHLIKEIESAIRE